MYRKHVPAPLYAHAQHSRLVLQGFNVTVNRAKALLIVVGNPNTIKTDRTWKRYVTWSAVTAHMQRITV